MKRKPTTRKTSLRSHALAPAVVAGAVLAGCAKPTDDGNDAKVTGFTDLNDYRYCELCLIGGDAVTKGLKAAFYNSTELNGATAANRDSCPQAVWNKVDIEAVKEEYGVLAVFKNGPRYCMYDWIELPVGAERDFNGYHGRCGGVVELPKGAAGLNKKVSVEI